MSVCIDVPLLIYTGIFLVCKCIGHVDSECDVNMFSP